MRFVTDKGVLLKALQHVTGVVERKGTIPILSNVLMTAGPDGLRLRATDLDIEVVNAVSAETKSPGGATVSAHLLHDIVRKLPDAARIDLSRAEGDARVTLAAGQAKFALAALPADEFPDLGKSEMTHRFDIPSADLRKLIEKTRFAISSDDSRYYLHGIYLHAVEKAGQSSLRAVATDGHRLAQMDVALPDGAKGMPGVIVPRKTVMEALKLMTDDDSRIAVELSASRIRLNSGDVVLTSKLIDGSFPDYARVIPQSNDKILTIQNADFVSAVDRVSTLSSDKGRAVKMNIAPEKLTLSVNNPDSGSATEELSVEYSSAPLEIGFNARYLLDISAQFGSEALQFKLSDPSSPAVIQDAGDAAALYVLMPMRV
ncbi:MAG: DNA polymerase III subunit beta [Hyphomicrobiales bacterium]|nr:DNA polymerase III subunit beta [Hyphomicrobiales bacterium]